MSRKKNLKVKVCGMKFPQNIQEIASLEPDYLGFIFHANSPRYCGQEGKEILENISGKSIPVMVSVNMPEEELLDIVDEWGFKVVQLHGKETPELCECLKARGLEVWKAIPIGRESGVDPFEDTAKYEGKVDILLFDTASQNHGGTGEKFNWKLLQRYNGITPFMLSGGISPKDANAILNISHPQLAGVDLNSRFEISPGLKDSSILAKFINEIKI